MLKLLQVHPRRLIFSPIAWAKVKYFFTMAGKLEMSGFGISDPKNLLYIKDFQTVGQVSDGTNTEFDDMALNKYIGEMARRKIPPAQCARVWIHSHPFAKGDTMPGPSQQDKDTFKDKICDGWNVDWGVMVIVGAKETYCELFTKVGKFKGYIRYQLSVHTDWMRPFWDEHDDEWAAEFEKNIIEVIPEPEIVAPADRKSGDIPPYPYDTLQWSQEEEDRWRMEWVQNPRTTLNRRQWIFGRADGFTVEELLAWGTLCVWNKPDVLRATTRKIHDDDMRKLKKARERRARKDKKDKEDKKKGRSRTIGDLQRNGKSKKKTN